MLRSIFRWRVVLIGCLLLLVPVALAQETDLCEDVDLIEYGDAGDGEIDDDLPFSIFCFEGEEGDEVTITVETTDGDLIPSVFLANPVFEEDIEVFGDDTARNENDPAEITVTLPDDGVYLIIVSREDTDQGDTEGEFEMQLEGEGDGSDRTSNNSDVENFCDEEPIATLSRYQYGIPSSNPNAPLMAYNVGCTGFLVSTIAGRSEIGEYEINRRGEMTFTIGEDTEFTTVEADEDEWIIDVSNGNTLELERLEDAGCDDEPLSDLISGAWVGDDNLVFDFTCNGIMLLIDDGDAVVGTYELSRSDIAVSLEGGDLLLEDFEVDGSSLNAEIDGDSVELENVLD